MGEIRDWGAFLRGRWDWTRGGFEKGFPRGCQFTDVDACVEFDGKMLVIETKAHDGTGSCEYPPQGQLISLRKEVELGKTVFVIYGCGPCMSPQALRILGLTKPDDQFIDWRNIPSVEHRRGLLKQQIDIAMGLQQATTTDVDTDSSRWTDQDRWDEYNDWLGEGTNG